MTHVEAYDECGLRTGRLPGSGLTRLRSQIATSNDFCAWLLLVVSILEVPANGISLGPVEDTFTGRERVRKCTRFVPCTCLETLPDRTNIPANRTKADARTRTGDPFITSDERMSAPVRSSHFRPLAKGACVDWSGLEVTGEANLVDGWWTSRMLPLERTVPGDSHKLPFSYSSERDHV